MPICLSETCGQACGEFRFISEKEVSKTGIYRLSINSNRIIYKNNEFTFQVFSQDSKALVSFQTKGATKYIYVDPKGKECEGEGCEK